MKKKVFSSIGLDNLYETISVDGFSSRSLLQFAKSKLTDEYVNHWKVDTLNQSKLRTYIQIKEEYKCENYVTMNLPRNLRSFIAQIRCGVLPLRIETGRFINLRVEECVCTLCNL